MSELSEPVCCSACICVGEKIKAFNTLVLVCLCPENFHARSIFRFCGEENHYEILCGKTFRSSVSSFLTSPGSHCVMMTSFLVLSDRASHNKLDIGARSTRFVIG